MTISARSTPAEKRENGDGLTVDFNFDFPIWVEEDVTVYKIDTSVSPEVQTEMTLGVDFSIVFDTDNESGTVTYTVAPTSDEDSYIVRTIENAQPSRFPERGDFNSKSMERALDRLTALLQDTGLADSPTVLANLLAQIAVVTNLVALAQAVDANNMTQANMSDNYGVVVLSATAPTDTNALWYDTTVDKLKKYNVGTTVWDIIRDAGTALTMADITDLDLSNIQRISWITPTVVLNLVSQSNLTYTDLDISATIPDGSTAAILKIFVRDTAAEGIGTIVRKDSSGDGRFYAITNMVSATRGMEHWCIVPVTAARKIQYSLEAGGTGTLDTTITVLGYLEDA